MANRVFFSFHYQDVIDFRANVVRNQWLTKSDREAAGFYDASLWESTKCRSGDAGLKRLINSGLDNTSNSCILIGSQTWQRPWVRYEILKSYKRGNHLFGVHINSIKGQDGLTRIQGPNPFLFVGVTFSNDGCEATLWEVVGAEWAHYEKIDGTATYTCNQVPEPYRGNGYNLSNFCPVYDWKTNDGFNNFGSWVRQ